MRLSVVAARMSDPAVTWLPPVAAASMLIVGAVKVTDPPPSWLPPVKVIAGAPSAMTLDGGAVTTPCGSIVIEPEAVSSNVPPFTAAISLAIAVLDTKPTALASALSAIGSPIITEAC